MTVNLGFVHPLSILTSAHQQKLQLEMPGTTCAGCVLFPWFQSSCNSLTFPSGICLAQSVGQVGHPRSEPSGGL